MARVLVFSDTWILNDCSVDVNFNELFPLMCLCVNTYVFCFPDPEACGIICMISARLVTASIIEGLLLTGKIVVQDQAG